MVIRAKKKKQKKKTDVSAPPEALVMRHTLLLYCFFSTCATNFAGKEGLLVFFCCYRRLR